MKIIAIINNNSFCFFSEENKNINFIKNSPLIFYYNKIENTFINSFKLKIFALENNSNTYSNILSNIVDAKTIDTPLAKDFNFFIENIFTDVLKKYDSYENIELIFSDSISSIIKDKLLSFLSAKYKISDTNFSLTELISKAFIVKKQITSNTENIIIIENSDEDLYVANINFDSQNINIGSAQNYLNFVFDPSAYAIAEKIVNDIIRIYSPKIENLQENIIYVYYKLLGKQLEIEHLPKDFVVLSTNLINSKERYTIRIETSNIKLLKQVYLNKILNKINSDFSNSQQSQNILFGNIFTNDEVKEFFENNFYHTNYLSAEEVLKTRNETFVESSDEFSTMFLESATEDIEQTNSTILSTLDTKALENGQTIKLTTYDSAPNKGYATQILENLGNNKFVVIESTRSLKTGDIVEAENNVWHAGIKLIFNVNRNGKVYGRFQTREIQTIEILFKKS